ncbi:hypothetical protein HG530_012801 [Fusarium avenaceum]|nr:hypothetical protein HG530_012801 [Fusarium avenaceum]
MKESRASRILGNGVVLAVSRLAAVKRLSVLANDDILGLNGGNGTEDANLFVADVLGIERDGSLHSQESENLEEMVLHNITNNAKLVEVTSTSFSAEGLLECDLDVVDVLSVPCGAEEGVTESEDQNVLDHLLSKVVVNSEQLLLVPVGLERLLKLTGAGEILTEGLLDLWVC